jgi:hypothetical protein
MRLAGECSALALTTGCGRKLAIRLATQQDSKEMYSG